MSGQAPSHDGAPLPLQRLPNQDPSAPTPPNRLSGENGAQAAGAATGAAASDLDLDVEQNTVLDPGDELTSPLLHDLAAPHARCCTPAVFVTTLLTVSDMLSGLASGMTVKFFAIFFLEQCELRPATVAAVAAAAPCGVALAAAAAQRIAARVGRVEVSREEGSGKGRSRWGCSLGPGPASGQGSARATACVVVRALPRVPPPAGV